MAVLDDILAAQQADQNQGLALAAHGAAWANYFNSTPTVDKLRANQNLTNVVADALQNKQNLEAQTSLKAAQIRDVNARHDEFMKQAPLREDLLRAQTAATGAAERRRAAEATIRANDTRALNEDIHAAYRAGIKPGSPAFQDAVFSSIAKNTHADPTHVREAHKLAGGADEVTDPVAFATEGVAMKEAARTAGIKNPKLRNSGGKWVVDESPDVITADQRTADAVARAKALQAAKPPEQLTPKQAGFLGRYDAPVSALSDIQPILKKGGFDLNAQFNGSASEIDKAVVAGKITKDEAEKAAKAIDKFRKASGKQTDYQSHYDEVSAELGALKKQGTPASTEGPKKVTSAQEFHDLPSGAEFIDPQGVKRRKP